ncbi:hypothetical protein ACFOHT_07460 [Massilia oculi]|uniref:hypothetical protein n=1 Tax=Massilia oculi TaxID=945844 RepID=UPI0013B3C018|nr:hypothetical protein [Massilia oculi]
MQLLAVAKASSPHVDPEHWIWKAINDLNKLRNTLSHESRPKALSEKIEAYLKFIIENSGKPLPPPAYANISEWHDSKSESNGDSASHAYSAIDMVTIHLYYYAASILGYKLDAEPTSI